MLATLEAPFLNVVNFYFFISTRDFNIMDTMITMMERYTDQLEDIVAERTSELAAEKAKTDELLYRMLPRYQGYIVPRSVGVKSGLT